MSHEQVMSWFQSRLNRNPEAYDVYQVILQDKDIGSKRLLSTWIIL